MTSRTLACGVLSLMAALGPSASGAPSQTRPMKLRDTFSDTWAATDALGRALPNEKAAGPPRKGKTVGIFYFLWLGHHGTDLYDNTQLLKADPTDPKYGPPGAFHWWGEPKLGYYRSNDEFVIRKHAQMLADAGVDVVIFDVTNGFTYDAELLAVCRAFEAVRRTGRTTPGIAFITNSGSANVVGHLYETFYAKNLYPDLWFRWKGKPLMLASEEGLKPEVRDFFTLRRSWAWSKGQEWFGDGKDRWPWIDNTPQGYGWHESPDKPEEMSVAVAQHPTSNIGRSFHGGKEPPSGEAAPGEGLHFAEQWKHALETDPEFVFVTGWNEWVAQRFVSEGGGSFLGRPLAKGDTFFVDQYNEEYSRDIEPMKGGHGDNYYYQLVANIRRYKGVRPLRKPSAPKTIRITDDFSQWSAVKPEYLDDVEDTAHRDHSGWGTKRYVNASGRNDFDTMKAARDATHLYFYARTHAPITPPEGDAWMLLLLDTDADPKTGWNGYDFLVNRTRNGIATASLERNVGGRWEWKPVADVSLSWKGREMHLAIPRKRLGVGPERGPLRLRFKWADHVPSTGDILDFMDQGDVAPNGRFSYRYEE